METKRNAHKQQVYIKTTNKIDMQTEKQKEIERERESKRPIE